MTTAETIHEIEDALDADDYESAGGLLGALVLEKQRQYGNALKRAAEMLAILWPDGLPVDQYLDACSVMRVIEKLSRVAAGDLGDESAWLDIAGHGLVAARLSRQSVSDFETRHETEAISTGCQELKSSESETRREDDTARYMAAHRSPSSSPPV